MTARSRRAKDDGQEDTDCRLDAIRGSALAEVMRPTLGRQTRYASCRHGLKDTDYRLDAIREAVHQLSSCDSPWSVRSSALAVVLLPALEHQRL